MADIVGERSGAYEHEPRSARVIAVPELTGGAVWLGANAVVGLDIACETVRANGSLLTVGVSGSAVASE